MNLPQNLITRIEAINWFSNCGKDIQNSIEFEVVYESSWKKAAKQSQGKYWETITLEANNDLTEYLFHYHIERYKKWNKFAELGRERIEQVVVPMVTNYLNEKQLPLAIMDNVKWDILLAIMEEVYREERKPKFFIELLKVYESGNFPCGWKGSWPEGKLLVY